MGTLNLEFVSVNKLYEVSGKLEKPFIIADYCKALDNFLSINVESCGYPIVITSDVEIPSVFNLQLDESSYSGIRFDLSGIEDNATVSRFIKAYFDSLYDDTDSTLGLQDIFPAKIICDEKLYLVGVLSAFLRYDTVLFDEEVASELRKYSTEACIVYEKEYFSSLSKFTNFVECDGLTVPDIADLTDEVIASLCDIIHSASVLRDALERLGLLLRFFDVPQTFKDRCIERLKS